MASGGRVGRRPTAQVDGDQVGDAGELAGALGEVAHFEVPVGGARRGAAGVVAALPDDEVGGVAAAQPFGGFAS